MPLQDREQIQALLDAMRKGATPSARFDSLRRLLSLLSYETARVPLRPSLPAEVSTQLADARVGIATAGHLDALWRDYESKKKDDSNFDADRLSHLFFRGLNNPSHLDLLATNRGESAPESFLQRRIGDVPYLNGGLFERSDDGSDEEDAGIVIPDKAVRAILQDLFSRFNFTVTESTPLDVEVAVDPGMLGKVFEELVTGRHESGSYYTPKPIVSFMCREETQAANAKTPVEGDSDGAA